MAYTLQQSINWARTFIQYGPLTAGINNEPAISIANTVQNTICNAPLTWGWNRAEYFGLTLTTAVQDYTVLLTDFSFLERVSLRTADTLFAYELKDVYNSDVLGVSVSPPSQPKSVAVKFVTYGTSLALRFLGLPDQNYTATLTYQKLITPITTLGQAWGIPDQYLDIYNNLFLAEAFQAFDEDQQAAKYRMRGIAALLAKSEGLSELQKNAFLAQFLARDAQAVVQQLKTNQGTQARGV